MVPVKNIVIAISVTGIGLSFGQLSYMKKQGKLVGVCNCQCHCDLKECFTEHDRSCKHCWN
jgi:hypothetical protein